jgi:hypothetical protein
LEDCYKGNGMNAYVLVDVSDANTAEEAAGELLKLAHRLQASVQATVQNKTMRAHVCGRIEEVLEEWSAAKPQWYWAPPGHEDAARKLLEATIQP